MLTNLFSRLLNFCARTTRHFLSPRRLLASHSMAFTIALITFFALSLNVFAASAAAPANNNSQASSPNTTGSSPDTKPHPESNPFTAAFGDFSQIANFFTAGRTGVSCPNSIAVDEANEVYYADKCMGTIVMEVPRATGGSDAVPVASGLNHMVAIAVDNSSSSMLPFDVFVLDSGNLYEYVAAGQGTATTFTKTLILGFAIPTNIAIDQSNNIYITDSGTALVTELVYQSPQHYSVQNIGSAWQDPTAVAVDLAGNVYVADYISGHNDTELWVVLNISGSPKVQLKSATPPSNPLSYANVTGLTVNDQNGIIYVTDTGKAGVHTPAIYVLYNNQQAFYYSSYIMSMPDVPSPSGHPFTLSSASGGALDSFGNFYTTDPVFSNILEYSQSAGQVQVNSQATLNQYVEVNFVLTGSGTLGQAVLLRQGTTGVQSANNFSIISDSCSNQTFTNGGACAVGVLFNPTMPGVAVESVVLENSGGQAIAFSPSFTGVGVGPRVVFFPGNIAPANSGYPGKTADNLVSLSYLDTLYVVDGSAGGNCGAIYSGNSTPWQALNTETDNNVQLCPTGTLAIDGNGNILFGAEDVSDGHQVVAVLYNLEAAGFAAPQILVDPLLTGNKYLSSIDALTVDNNDNLYFSGSDDAQFEYLYFDPRYNWFNNPSPQPSGIFKLPTDNVPFTAIPSIAVDNMGDVYYIAGKQLYYDQASNGDGHYGAPVPVYAPFDTPTQLAFDASGQLTDSNALNHLYVLDAGLDTGISILYMVGGISSQTPALYPVPLLSSDTTVNNNPVYFHFTTDLNGNYFFTDGGESTTPHITNVLVNPVVSQAAEVQMEFANTVVGQTSSDSPQALYLYNAGNADMNLVPPASGENPGITPAVVGQSANNFLYNDGSSWNLPGDLFPVPICPALTSSSSPFTISQDNLCAVAVSFTPQNATFDESYLNITLAGTGIDGLSNPPNMGTWQVNLYGTGIQGAAPTVQLLASPNPAATGAPVTFTVTVTGTGPTPTGTVNLFYNAQQIGTGTLSNGLIQFTISNLPVGTDPIQADYLGDTNYAATNSAVLNEVINQNGATVQLLSSANPANSGSVVTFTVTVTGSTPTGTVNLFYKTQQIATGTLTAGSVQFPISTLPVGSDAIQADYLGDTNNAAANSAILNEVIQQGGPTVQLLSSANPSLVLNPVTFSVNVSGGSVTPTGTVNLIFNSAVLATGPLTNGVASFTVTTLPVGSDPITAAYSGDANYSPATSAVLTEIIEDFNITLTTPVGSVPPIVKAGDSLTVSVTVAPVAPATTIPTDVTITATGGPQGTGYTFDPAVVTAGSGSTTVAVTINIPVDFVAKNDAPTKPADNNPTRIPLAPLALALLFFPMAGLMRKSGKRISRMAAMLLLAIAGISATAALIGCGANKAAVYEITVTGTSGALSHANTFDITVEGR